MIVDNNSQDRLGQKLKEQNVCDGGRYQPFVLLKIGCDCGTNLMHVKNNFMLQTLLESNSSKMQQRFSHKLQMYMFVGGLCSLAAGQRSSCSIRFSTLCHQNYYLRYNW